MRGPAHRRGGLPNQDAWAGRAWGDQAVLVVADGMGSRPHADIGSRAACDSVLRSVGRWRRAPGAPIGLLLRLIHLEWRMNIHPRTPSSCATTCRFALLRPDGVLLAGLGDGLSAIQGPAGAVVRLGGPEQDFTNETTGLGVAASVDEWRVQEVARGEGVALLATDGVSEELAPGTHGALMGWLRAELRDRSPTERARWLRSELHGMNAQGRIDDRTLAVAWTDEEER